MFAGRTALQVLPSVPVVKLFALHPVGVDSVAWVTERKNTLSGLFYLGSILVLLGRFYRRSKHIVPFRPQETEKKND